MPANQILLFGEASKLWINDWWPSSLGPCHSPKSAVRNLRVIIDCKLSMSDHINNLVRTSYGLMRSLRKIFKWIPLSSRIPLVQGLIISRLDYGNSLFASINEDL